MIRFRKMQVALVTLSDLFGRLGSAEMHHHVWIAQQLLEE
jgi:hypothetical protein